MTGHRPGALLSILGPPAVGKSTLTAHLATDQGAAVFRLREFASTFRGHHPHAEQLLATTDPLGWFADTAVDIMLRAAFIGGLFPIVAAQLVVLESLPGTPFQVNAIARLAADLGVAYALLELTATDEHLCRRADVRRVCGSCEPGPEPRRPAQPDQADPACCAACGTPLRRRSADHPAARAARTGRYQDRISSIRLAADHHGLRWLTVDANGTAADVRTGARTAMNELRIDHVKEATR